MQDEHEIAASIASQLGEVSGVKAVALADSRSCEGWPQEEDIDLRIYYDDSRRPSVSELQGLANQLNSFMSSEMVTDFWHQGSLLNGEAWLWVEGRRVRWQYRDVGRVRSAMEHARSGGTTVYYRVGYPHGFFSYYFLGEIACSQPLFDPEGILRQLKKEAFPYPEPLKRALAEGFVREADVTLFGAQRAVSADDLFYASGCVYRAIACLIQVLHAINGRYVVGERLGVEAVNDLAEHPSDFKKVVQGVLSRFGMNRDDRMEAIKQLRGLTREIQVEYVNPLTASESN